LNLYCIFQIGESSVDGECKIEIYNACLNTVVSSDSGTLRIPRISRFSELIIILISYQKDGKSTVWGHHSFFLIRE